MKYLLIILTLLLIGCNYERSVVTSRAIEAAQYKCESFNGLKHVSAYVLYNKHGYVVGFNIKSVCNDDTKIEHSIKNKK